jgi:hypothetical protein
MENSEVIKNTKILIVEWITILGVFIGGFFYLANKIDRQGERIDRQGERTDKLYEMFIDLLKEGRK